MTQLPQSVRTHRIPCQGQWLLLNKVYGLHRFQASKFKTEWKHRFSQLFKEAQIQPFLTFSVRLRYWSRMDADGTVTGLKVVIDTLREMGLAVNDDKRYFKGFEVTLDPNLKHNRYELTLVVHSEPQSVESRSMCLSNVGHILLLCPQLHFITTKLSNPSSTSCMANCCSSLLRSSRNAGRSHPCRCYIQKRKVFSSSVIMAAA
jgi:hypothetical protein